MIIYENNHRAGWRWIFDRLPHEMRRTLHRIFKPADWAQLQAMRQADGLGPLLDLTSFLRRNALFVHVPKAAGRSVRKGLFEGRTASHMTMYHYRIAFSRHEFARMFKFAFVRNPWDRCHSAYNFLMAGGVNHWDRGYAEKHLVHHGNFERFVLNGLGTPGVMSIVHFLPASHFLEVRPGILPIDFIGYFEQFDSDFRRIATHLGCECDSAPWENKTQSKERGYLESYTSAMRDRVAEIYRRDIDLFGYSFDGYAPNHLNG